jgi:hypothetical protein
MPKVILDNDISFRIAKALVELGEDVTTVRDEFGPDAKDLEWIPEAAKKGWVILTADNRLLRNPSEKEMLKKHKASLLVINPFFNKQNVDLWGKAAWIVSRWKKIRGFADGMAKGTVARVKQNGTCEIVQL